MRGFAGGFLTVTGVLYILLMTNLLIAVTCLPVWVLALLVDLRVSWLWAGLASILLGPALAGAYAVFRDYSLNGSVTAVRTFGRAWRASWRRAGPVAVAVQAFILVVLVDFYALSLWGLRSLALPLTVVLVAGALVTAAVTWVGLAERGDLSRRAVVKASVYLAVRKFGWSLVSLAVLVVVGMVTWRAPALGLGLLAAPGLYVVWGNSRRTWMSLLPATAHVTEEVAR
ncbi:MAG: hypothetical protein LBI33_11040 [Propionibacteriaceae bacterium]|jgi:uncharacterized membrane protein YesL|nr:hypothetical protein [Propionibacteriaceae bacterium]